MCGIAGKINFNPQNKFNESAINQAIEALSYRGPDANGYMIKNDVCLIHTRLSILDLSADGNQPMSDPSERYHIVFNGEIYNYRALKKELLDKGVNFKSQTDTEVLLQLLIQEGINCLNKLNGFFAFAFYDSLKKETIIARDRYGIKPLHYYIDSEKLIFGSELKALDLLGMPKKINPDSVYTFFRLTYIPAPYSIYKNCHKLKPGHYLKIAHNTIQTHQYYKIPYPENKNSFSGTYQEACKKLYTLMNQSVEDRMISDVPLGSFLSGGIDSSIISALAAQKVSQLQTFSIGYKDEPFYDETYFAELVAKKIGSKHTVFKLSNDDLYENLHQVLDYLDEPFGDSSALAVNILSMHTRKNVTVALSGDGGDELFAGYHKHKAEYIIQNLNPFLKLLLSQSKLLAFLPQNRGSKFANIIRQINKLADGAKRNKVSRYIQWASFNKEEWILNLLKNGNETEFINSLSQFTNHFEEKGINDVLLSDMNLTLQGDMLTKVDLMSMNHSLEVRVPFLDYRIVNFAFTLPDSYKIDKYIQKKILQDSFRSLLPENLYNRPKKGFEVPLIKWFKSELKTYIYDELLDEEFLKSQNIFDLSGVKMFKNKFVYDQSGDYQSLIWCIVVFQHWYKKSYLS